MILNLNTVVPLHIFRTVGSGLTPNEAALVVDQALFLLDELYAHLPLKAAMHATDPVQKLKVLKRQLGKYKVEYSFHEEMLNIFKSVQDLHTNYMLPEPFGSATAFLPFFIDEYFDSQKRNRFIVKSIMNGAEQIPFVPGVEITHWNGMPMWNAVALNSMDHAGSNESAQWRQGLLRMTTRPMLTSLAPREDWVTVTYLQKDGTSAEIRYPWLVFYPPAKPGSVNPNNAISVHAMSVGLDASLEVTHRARQILYRPESIERAERMTQGESPAPQGQRKSVGEDAMANFTSFPNELEYGTQATRSGTFAWLRIRSFNVNDFEAFVKEVVRILELLPQNGIIIDVRGNPGGNILAGEHLLQLFTNSEVTSAPMQFRNTQGAASIAASDFLAPWRESIGWSVETGSVFSQGFGLSSPETINAIGRRYKGKSILLTDAASYSTTDIFAAGFQDHSIGPVLGLDESTGAGGANVWTHELLRQFWPASSQPAIVALPRGIQMRVSLRRSVRVGANSGMPLEDLGARSDYRHYTTLRDLQEDHADLFDRAGELLKSL